MSKENNFEKGQWYLRYAKNRPTHWRKRNRADERMLISRHNDYNCHREIKRRTVIGNMHFQFLNEERIIEK